MNLVSDEMAAKIAQRGFPEGGSRTCRKCRKTKAVTLEEIISWPQLRPPDCLICKGRTELLTPEEAERMK